jgi:hypothetical protein
MARKRGGLAGLYDRNKGVIQKAAPVLAGVVGGPLAGAAVGAAMRGLDREGKSGIGFDVGQGLRGGMEGYAGGAAGKGLKGMFTAGMNKMSAASAAKKLASKELTGAPTVGLTANAPSAASLYGNIPMPTAGAMPDIATQMASPVKSGAMDVAKKAGGFLERNQSMLAGAAKGVAGVMGSRAEGDAAADRLALEQSRFDYDKERDTLAEAKRRRLAQLTGTMFAPMMANVSPSGRGNPAMTMPQYLDSTGANATPEEFGPEMMGYINSRR